MPLLYVVEVATLQLSQLTLTSTDTARNLGCFFDRHMQLDRLVSSYCSSAYYHLRTINNIRHLLTLDACHAAVRSLVLSRLDLIVAWHRLNADLLKCYNDRIGQLLDSIDIPQNSVHCTDVLCENDSHRSDIDTHCKQLIDVLLRAGDETLPQCKVMLLILVFPSGTMRLMMSEKLLCFGIGYG